MTVAVVLQTYKRTSYAVRTVQAMKKHWKGALAWFVADDGSPAGHVQEVVDTIGGEGITVSSSKRGYGGCANWAIDATALYPITLWLEDDWELVGPFDPKHYIDTLNKHADIAMIRLGYLPIGLDCHTNGYDGWLYLHVLRTTAYMFSGNPALRHRRFFDAFGRYPTGQNPGQTEVSYDWQCRSQGNTPKILYPVDNGTWGLFGHIGEVKSF